MKNKKPSPIPRRSTVLLLLMLLLVSALVTHTVAATPGQSGQAGGQVKKSPFAVEQAEIERLQKQGHTLEDIYTALNLADKTGVPAAKWLAEIKQGKTWPQAIEKLAKGVPLKKRPLSDQGWEIPEEEIYAMLKQGMSFEDVRAIYSLVYDYGGDPQSLLDRKESGETWDAMRNALDKEWRERYKEVSGGFLLGESGKDETTPSGLSKKEILALQEQGYSIADILKADAVATAIGLDFRAVAATRPKDKTLYEAVLEADAKRTPEERAKARKSQPTNNGGKVKLESGLSPSGLTEEEINALISRGSAGDVLAADALAKTLGLDFRKIANSKRNEQSYTDAVRQADKERPVAKENLPGQRPTEELLIKHYAKQLGKSETELRQARSSGKSWESITGVKIVSYEEQAIAQAKSWGLSDERLVLQAVEQGLAAFDAFQATVLAKNSALSPSEILKLKTPTNTWIDVITMIHPGIRVPEAPSAPPEGTEKKPIHLEGGGQ